VKRQARESPPPFPLDITLLCFIASPASSLLASRIIDREVLLDEPPSRSLKNGSGRPGYLPQAALGQSSLMGLIPYTVRTTILDICIRTYLVYDDEVSDHNKYIVREINLNIYN